MNTDAPPRKAKAALDTRLATLPPTNRLERKHWLPETQALSLTLPLPAANTPVDFDSIRSEASRLAREFRRSGQARHYRALLAHCAGAGLRLAMVNATASEDAAAGIRLLSDAMADPQCAGCSVAVDNSNLGGHDGHSALTGHVYCLSCADSGKGGAQ